MTATVPRGSDRTRQQEAAVARRDTTSGEQGGGDPRRAAGRERADPAPAPGARGDPQLGRPPRLPAEHARDRRGGRPDQPVQRRPPARRAGAQGLPAPRPQPAARHRGPLPRRRRRRPGYRRRRRATTTSTCTGIETTQRARRPPTCRCSAGSPPAGRSWPRRPSRTSSRSPAQLVGEGTLFLLKVGRRLDGRRRDLRRRLGGRAPAARRRQRRHRRGDARRRGHRQDVQAHATATCG